MSSPHWLQRTALLIGDKNIATLAKANVLVIGLGGVGSYAAEFLCRAGIGKMTIADGDVVDVTNKNRQLQALSSTVGMSKATLMGARLRDINPDLQLTVIDEFLTPERMQVLINPEFDFALDCIDSIQPKLQMIATCINNDVHLISSMGAGGRVDASQIKIMDIWQTYNCPFAQQIRKGLKRIGVKQNIKAVFSTEPVLKENMQLTEAHFKKSYYGTISYLPALFGINMASYVIRELMGRYSPNPNDVASIPKPYRKRG
ncbi:MAG: tRNA threonylcarbamoyladenosine dehydratase [Saprospiraceae bacterium]|nr:tRNA threonylcarbamoyladenosine dehydratase [Saprospiraceae bacterium]MBP7699796.1 tRNA threonylcarbamoyladenosine dehydratase [Saprospiraceae bacterium]